MKYISHISKSINPLYSRKEKVRQTSAEYILFFQSNRNLNCLNQISYDIRRFIRHCKVKIVFKYMKIVISWRHMLGAVLWKIHKIHQTHYSKQTQHMCNKEMTICLKMGIISNDQPLSILVSGILLFSMNSQATSYHPAQCTYAQYSKMAMRVLITRKEQFKYVLTKR